MGYNDNFYYVLSIDPQVCRHPSCTEMQVGEFLCLSILDEAM